MSHREELEPLGGALGEALGQLAQRGAPQALSPIWLQVAGAVAAGASRPSGFARGTLAIEVDTAHWLRELQHQEAALRARLARALPGFRALELRLRGSGR
jgi:hypothetical protein